MTGIAAIAGLGTNLLNGITPSAIDGFAAGTILSGLCFLLVMVPRRRSRRASRTKLSASAASAKAPRIPMTPEPSRYVAAPAYAVATPVPDPFADESAEVVVSFPVREHGAQLADVKDGDHRSKHRVSATGVVERRPELRRGTGRHAAPPVGRGSRMVSRLALHPVAIRS